MNNFRLKFQRLGVQFIFFWSKKYLWELLFSSKINFNFHYFQGILKLKHNSLWKCKQENNHIQNQEHPIYPFYFVLWHVWHTKVLIKHVNNKSWPIFIGIPNAAYQMINNVVYPDSSYALQKRKSTVTVVLIWWIHSESSPEWFEGLWTC